MTGRPPYPLKLLKHPDCNEIVKRLTEGGTIRDTNQWLKEKYWDKPRLILSTNTLQTYRKKYLKLEKKVIQDIRAAQKTEQTEITETARMKALESTSAYQDKINEIADTHLDVAQKILQLDAVIGDRMKYWYDAVKSGEESPGVADKELRQFIDRQMGLLQQYKKFVEGMADKTVDYNVNVTVLNDQIEMIKNVIKEVLMELDSEVSILFMEKFNRKLANIQYKPEKPEKVNVKALNAMEAELVD
jgi:hypothetical protein